MMTLDEAIKHCEEVAEEQDKLCKVNDSFNFSQPKWEKCAEEHRQLAEWLKELKQLRQQASWIPIVYREATQEEKDDYFARNGEELCYMVESEMPEHGQEVLVSSGGYVSEDIFDEDYYSFENHEIIDVDAWMPLPKAYGAEK